MRLQSVMYGSGSFVGSEFTDTVSTGYGLSINKQSIGAAFASNGFDGVDGILGYVRFFCAELIFSSFSICSGNLSVLDPSTSRKALSY